MCENISPIFVKSTSKRHRSDSLDKSSSATAEIACVNGLYAVLGHLRSLMLVPVGSPNVTSC